MTKKIKFILKRSLVFVLLSTIIFSISSCDKEQQKYIKDAIAIVYLDDVPYLINAEKEMYNLSDYDEIIEIFNDYIAVKKDGNYGFIDRTGKLVIDTIYKKVYPMYEEKAVVIKNNKYYVINNLGETIYEFKDGIVSDSYFSNNHLVVSKENKYGYLCYNPDDGNFTLTDLEFDYARCFDGDYAVIGQKEQQIIYKTDDDGNQTDEIEEIKVLDNIKYNFYTLDNNVLFEEFLFDSAESFHDGYARVGTKTKIYSPIVGGIEPTKEFDGMMYKYIDIEGNYLNFDYQYEYSYRGTNELRYTEGVVEMPYATNFVNGLAVIAKYRYSTVINTYVKEFMILDTEGKLHFTEAIYYETGFRYGYEHLEQFQAISPGRYWIGDLINVGDVLAYTTCNTINNPSWTVKYIKYDYEDKIYNAVKVTWNLFTYETNEQGEEIKIIPDWIKKYNEEFLNSTSSTIIVENAVNSSFEMTDLAYSKYYSDTTPINRIRILRSNKFGLVKYIEQKTPINGYQYESEIIASFILEPIYDRIIY